MAREPGVRALPPPVCKAILLCEKVVRDEFTGLYSLINIFDDIHLYSLPCLIGPYLLFLQVTDGLGRYQISVEIQDLSTGSVLARADQPEIELADKNVKWIGILGVPPFLINEAGAYDILVLANGQEINRQKITINQLKEHDDG